MMHLPSLVALSLVSPGKHRDDLESRPYSSDDIAMSASHYITPCK
jgi:hypothetical protein